MSEAGNPGSRPGSSTGSGGAAEGAGDDAPDGAVDRVDYDPDYDPARPIRCEVCGATMYYTAACKLKCPRCGYTRDCSDP